MEPTNTLKLKPRTTYVANSGRVVHIGGLSKCPPIDGHTIYFSIQGDWYAEDGRRVHGRILPSLEGSWVEGQLRYEQFLLPAAAQESVSRECTDAESVAWWRGVLA